MDVTAFSLNDLPARQRYDALFESCPRAFIQQSTYWAEAIAELGPDEPIFLLCSEAGQDVAGLPLYLYRHALGNVLTSVPQAGPLGGVFHRAGLSAEILSQIYGGLLQRTEVIAREHECLSLTLITNPFEQDHELYFGHLKPDHVFENFTQYIRLDEMVADDTLNLRDYQRRSNLSRNLRGAKAAGFSVELADSDEELSQWYEVHARRHEQLGAKPLPYPLFANIRRVLQPRGKASLMLVKKDGRIASGCLYVHHREELDVFMLSMDERFAEHGPNFLNTEQSLFWASKLGVRWYSWQSSPDRQSGVYKYKKQWGSQEALYYFVTKRLCEPERLARLGPDTLKSAYPWHYVVPFGAFEQGFEQRFFKKN